MSSVSTGAPAPADHTGRSTSRPPADTRSTADAPAAREVSDLTRRQRPLPEVRFLTVAEVASTMRVSKMTVYRLVHGGTLPAVRVGRSFRVPQDAVTDYLRDSFVQAG